MPLQLCIPHSANGHVLVEQGQEAQNLEPGKCMGWHWHSLQQVPTPRFRPLNELIALQAAHGQQRDSFISPLFHSAPLTGHRVKGLS